MTTFEVLRQWRDEDLRTAREFKRAFQVRPYDEQWYRRVMRRMVVNARYWHREMLRRKNKGPASVP